MRQKPTGYFSGTYELLELIAPPDTPPLPWYMRLFSLLFGGFGSPTPYLLEPDWFSKPTYHDSTGRAFVIDEDFEFDGATTPRLFWIIKGFSPWDWTKAAAFHDWFYWRHHQGRDVVTFEEANRLLGEMVRTLGVSEWKIKIITWAVNRFGCYWWDSKS